MMIDLTPLLALFKGKDAENFKVLIEAYKGLFEEQGKQITRLESKVTHLEEQLEKMAGLEERCLQQNVLLNDLVRNLVEFMIFEDRRPEKKNDLIHLLKEVKNIKLKP